MEITGAQMLLSLIHLGIGGWDLDQTEITPVTVPALVFSKELRQSSRVEMAASGRQFASLLVLDIQLSRHQFNEHADSDYGRSKGSFSCGMY